MTTDMYHYVFAKLKDLCVFEMRGLEVEEFIIGKTSLTQRSMVLETLAVDCSQVTCQI
jgi:hypothetical protein